MYADPWIRSDQDINAMSGNNYLFKTRENLYKFSGIIAPYGKPLRRETIYM